MEFIAEHMLYISAAYYVGIVLICAIVAYYTLVKKADHNLQLRDIVFRGIISFLLGSATCSIFTQVTSAIMISTRAIASPVFSQVFHIVDMMLCLGFAAAYYWFGRTVKMSFDFSPKQYPTIKLITALMIGWIAQQVIQLLFKILYLLYEILKAI